MNYQLPARARPELADVSLVAVTSVAIGPTIDALEASIRQAAFAEILLLSDQAPPSGTDPRITWRRIGRLASKADYSRFMLHELAEHVTTAHALCVQWDGFVLNGEGWNPEFLRYDYIGAVWPHFSDRHNVGNGGFSLRSRRLLEATRHLSFDGSEAEDVLIGRIYRPYLEDQGIRFAPATVAHQFAYERTAATGREFGFHGGFNLIRRLPSGTALRLFRSLEPGMLARNEKLELLRWAIMRGRWRFALAMLRRLA